MKQMRNALPFGLGRRAQVGWAGRQCDGWFGLPGVERALAGIAGDDFQMGRLGLAASHGRVPADRGVKGR